ncbi:uncharacterized protein LOC108150834 [Drosophila miranda]|uniref:uncharacterized protein LOC108150834 n=1 Tax=Drosophila miranda TaxID=7229 RepID=UPI0007E6A004|nr:uncharacterized protein LOC108150834 [Drosophila miranda]
MFSMQWLLLTFVVCLTAGNYVQARQIRINRYAVSVQEDEAAAQVRELKPTPYPAAGYRPQGRSFWLPGEVETDVDGVAAPSEGSGLGAETTTTEVPIEDASTSTTESADWSTTTTWDSTSLDTTTTAPPTPDNNLRSGRAFVRAPYPPAGYRPSRAFRLPTEENAEQQQQQQPEESLASNSTDSNADHPVCGVSTNPLMPTPEPGSKDEPDSESVVITANLRPAVLVARAPKPPSSIPVAIPLRSQPLMEAPRRGFVYTTHVEQRW